MKRIREKGSKLEVMLKLGEGALESYEVDNFTKFFTYVGIQPHIQRLGEAEGDEQSCFDPVLANTVACRSQVETGTKTIFVESKKRPFLCMVQPLLYTSDVLMEKREISSHVDGAFSLQNTYSAGNRGGHQEAFSLMFE